MKTYSHHDEDKGIKITFDDRGDIVEALYTVPDLEIEVNVTADLIEKRSAILRTAPSDRTYWQKTFLAQIDEWRWQAEYAALEASSADYDKDKFSQREGA